MEFQATTKDGRLVFAYKREDSDESKKVLISYRPGPDMPLCVELAVTENLIDDANGGVDDFLYVMVWLLEWLGSLSPDLAWAKTFPNDDALVITEPTGKIWENPGAWKYRRD